MIYQIKMFTYIYNNKNVWPVKQISWKGPAYVTLHTPLAHEYDIFWNEEKVRYVTFNIFFSPSFVVLFILDFFEIWNYFCLLNQAFVYQLQDKSIFLKIICISYNIIFMHQNANLIVSFKTKIHLRPGSR